MFLYENQPFEMFVCSATVLKRAKKGGEKVQSLGDSLDGELWATRTVQLMEGIGGE